MQRVCLICVALVLGSIAVADNPFTGGTISTQDFWAAWNGPTEFPPDAANAAAVYADSISDYDGSHCTRVFMAALSYPCPETVHLEGTVLAEHQGQAGFVFCNGSIDNDGYCIGVTEVFVSPNYDDDQTTWCHEFGHAMGAAHDSGRGDCLDTWEQTSTEYHQHHIDVHLQYE